MKSSNILVETGSNYWNLKLCDFGLSRRAYKIKDKNNRGRIGTPNWMAPEILRGEKYGKDSDVYSFGMIIWYSVIL